MSVEQGGGEDDSMEREGGGDDSMEKNRGCDVRAGALTSHPLRSIRRWGGGGGTGGVAMVMGGWRRCSEGRWRNT